MKAKWIHDCDACKYIASSLGKNGLFDWYVCNDTTVARYGDDGPEYWSMPTRMITNDDYLISYSACDDAKGYDEILLIARHMLSV